MGKGKRGVVAREMGMEERRGEQEKGVEGGEESGVKLSGRRELREGTIQEIYSKSPFLREMKVKGGGEGGFWHDIIMISGILKIVTILL